MVLINNTFLFKGHNIEDKCSEAGYCACENLGNQDTARIMQKNSLTFDPAVFSCSEHCLWFNTILLQLPLEKVALL